MTHQSATGHAVPDQPKYQRRKEEKGYAAARVEEVAKRAGVSKGLTYLYFKTKEELFKAVVKSVVVRRVDALVEAVDTTELSSEEFIRGPLLEFMKHVPGSPIAIVIKLLIAESTRHPDLVDYYFDNVVAKGLTAISRFVDRGVERGEFRRTAVNDLPQVVLAPMMLSMIWRLIFANRELDTDKLMETQIDMLLAWIRA